MQKLHVLLVEDNPDDVELLQEQLAELEGEPILVYPVDRISAGVSALETQHYDAILLDLNLPDSRGLDSPLRIKAVSSFTPVIVLTGSDDDEKALQALHAGAQDYLVKGQADTDRLTRSIRYALERASVEKALRQSQERYRLLAENLVDVVWAATPERRYTYISPSVEKLLGYSVAEAMALAVGETAHPDDRAAVEALVAQRQQPLDEVVEMRVNDRMELRLRHKQGHYVWVEATMTTVYEAGEAVGAFGVTRGIDERKQAEERLHQENAYVELLCEAAIVSNEGAPLDEAFQRVLDRAAQLIDWPVSHVWVATPQRTALKSLGIWPRNLPEHLYPIRQISEDVVIERGDGMVGHVFDSGAPCWHEDIRAVDGECARAALRNYVRAAFAVPVKVADETVAVVEFFHDEPKPRNERLLDVMMKVGTQLGRIAERKQAAQERATLGAALEQVTDTIIFIDTNRDIIYVNPAFESHYGYRREEVLGKPLGSMQSGCHNEAFFESIWDRLYSGHAWRGNMKVRTKSGDVSDADVSIAPVKDYLGAVSHYISIQRDVSEQRKLEEQLRQSQKMEAIGRLAGGVAHDFNNLLTAIQGYAELMGLEVKGNERAEHDLAQILRSVQTAASLTRQLLAFARKDMVQPRPLDLNGQLRSFESMLCRLLTENVHFECDAAAAVPDVVLDPGHFEQIVLNLVVNARDAMPRGGEITASTACVELSAEQAASLQIDPGRYVVLRVSDNGCGMDEETRSRIFEPFFTTKECGKGTGLGLSTVYGIVQQARGAVLVQSEPGSGTTFQVYLPALEQHAKYEGVAAAGEPAALRHLGKKGTVLLVEDESSLRDLVSRILTHHGWTVHAASGSDEAFKLIAQKEDVVDLLITDVVMPERNGPELAAELQALQPDLKVLLMSGYSSKEMGLDLDDLQRFPFVQKPFSSNDLMAAIDGAL